MKNTFPATFCWNTLPQIRNFWHVGLVNWWRPIHDTLHIKGYYSVCRYTCACVFSCRLSVSSHLGTQLKEHGVVALEEGPPCTMADSFPLLTGSTAQHAIVFLTARQCATNTVSKLMLSSTTPYQTPIRSTKVLSTFTFASNKCFVHFARKAIYIRNVNTKNTKVWRKQRLT